MILISTDSINLSIGWEIYFDRENSQYSGVFPDLIKERASVSVKRYDWGMNTNAAGVACFNESNKK